VGARQSAEPDSRLSCFVKLVLPTTLLKTVFEKNFIAIEAKKAMEQCAQGGANALPEAIDVLVEGCRHSKNLALAEQASTALCELIKRMPESFFQPLSASDE
jgi:Zn finger protein HypA/HybF involved in hydrogenase expression